MVLFTSFELCDDCVDSARGRDGARGLQLPSVHRGRVIRSDDGQSPSRKLEPDFECILALLFNEGVSKQVFTLRLKVGLRWADNWSHRLLALLTL